MGKISYKNKKGKIIISNIITYPENVNEQKYRLILSNEIDCLLPISMRAKRKQTILECTVENLMPLSQYLQGIITKQMFLEVVIKLIEIIKKCKKNNLDSKNLELENDKIFVDIENKSIKCVLWPIVTNHRYDSLFEYFKQLPYDLSFNPFEDASYLDEYRAFFETLEPFSLNNFEKIILKLSGKEIIKGHTISGTHDSGSKKKYIPKRGVEFDPFGSDANTSEKDNEREEEDFNEDELPPTVDFGTLVLEKDPEKGTIALGQTNSIVLTLIRLKTNERILINKTNFTIGKQTACDLCIRDNQYISRVHAKIVIRKDKYYIIDCKSTNKTYVDEEVINPEEEFEIFNGNSIRFADEEFSFSVEL